MTALALAVEAGRTLDRELADELEKQAAWVSPRVRDVRVDADGHTVRFIVDGGSPEEERAKVARFVADLTGRHRAAPSRVVVRRTSGRGVHRDAFGELARRGWVVEMGRGRVALRGPALAAVQALDEDCARIAATLGAEEESHPALAASELLARCGWFSSFPQAASFVAHLVEDYDAIERFRRANMGARDLVAPEPTTLAGVDACLLPALCYSVYAARAGRRLRAGAAVVTCAGRCFRYESRNLSGIERLWEFGMREVVFLGDDAAVAHGRQKAIDAAIDQLERWDLEGCLETANDPFFPAARPGKVFWQRSGERKLELRLPIAPGGASGDARAIACASFNMHDRFFGTTFDIAGAEGAPAASACAGWGEERWMLACFAQLGFDADRWPAWLRERVFR